MHSSLLFHQLCNPLMDANDFVELFCGFGLFCTPELDLNWLSFSVLSSLVLSSSWVHATVSLLQHTWFKQLINPIVEDISFKFLVCIQLDLI